MLSVDHFRNSSFCALTNTSSLGYEIDARRHGYVLCSFDATTALIVQGGAAAVASAAVAIAKLKLP